MRRFVGYAVALLLLLQQPLRRGILVTFPAWVLLVGGAVFVDELRRRG